MRWQHLLLCIPYFLVAQEKVQSICSSDHTIHYELTYDACGNVVQAENKISGETIYREYDPKGNLVREIFPNGHEITASYDSKKRPLSFSIPNLGEIKYIYDESYLTQVQRISPTGELLYQHSYHYDDLLTEDLIDNLGQVTCTTKDGMVYYQSPYSLENVRLDSVDNIVEHTYDEAKRMYVYDELSQLTLHHTYDFSYNPLDATVNEQNQLKIYRDYSCEYDSRGNLIQKESSHGSTYFYYDALNRLVKTTRGQREILFTYDFLNRRLSKTVVEGEKRCTQNYLYYHSNELAVFTEDGKIEQLRIPGRTFHPEVVRAVAIETPDATYAPLHDVQGNIAKLINTATREVISFAPLDPFGEDLQQKPNITPWLFSGKHYDLETNLVYFGHRYYDPSLKRWITPDPLGCIDSTNLYAYLLNNPFRYIDPNGQFVFVIPLGIGLWELLEIGAIAVAVWTVNEAVDKGNQILNQKRLSNEWKFQIDQLEWENLDIEQRNALEYPRIHRERALEQMYKEKYPKKELRDSSGKLQKEIERDQAPSSVDRADKGRGSFEKDHVHLDGDEHALNHDGTWKHGGRDLTNAEKKWLWEHGWEVPREQ